MDGIARSVNSVAFQADILAKEAMYQNPIFSNLDRQKDGVHFHLSTFINPDLINFQWLTSGAATALPPEEEPPPPASTSPFTAPPAQ